MCLKDRPSTAARRASARSRTSKLEPAVAEESAVPQLPSVSSSNITTGGDDSVLEIDDSSAAQELSVASGSSVSAVLGPVRQSAARVAFSGHTMPDTSCFSAEHGSQR